MRAHVEHMQAMSNAHKRETGLLILRLLIARDARPDQRRV